MAKTKALARPDDEIDSLAAEATALLARVAAGDQKANARVREILDGAPELWESLGNLAFQVEQKMIRSAAGDNEIVREGMQRKLDNMRRDLKGSNPSPLEKLLVSRVVACWFELNYAEATYYQRAEEGISWKESDYRQRYIDRTHRRYLSAIRTLATVRRLVLPALQVNVADQQINVSR